METISAEQYRELGKQQSSASPDDQNAFARQQLRSMGDYYDIPREKTEAYIKTTCMGSRIDGLMYDFAKTVGIAPGPAGFYIRQQELSGKIRP